MNVVFQLEDLRLKVQREPVYFLLVSLPKCVRNKPRGK